MNYLAKRRLLDGLAAAGRALGSVIRVAVLTSLVVVGLVAVFFAGMGVHALLVAFQPVVHEIVLKTDDIPF